MVSLGSKTIVFVGVNAGGTGKTFMAESIDAIAGIRGIEIDLASYDDGNHALIRSLGEKRVASIGGNVGIAKGREIVAKHFNSELLVIDCGANMLGGHGAAEQLAIGFKMEADQRGYRMLAVMPAGSGKVGGLDSAITAYDNLAAANIDCWLVLNDMNGSGGFGSGEIPDHVQRCNVNHLAAGFQALRVESGRPLYDLAMNPEPGRELAGQFIYAWLWAVAQGPLFQKIFGATLSSLPEPQVDMNDIGLTIATASATTNRRLALNLEFRRTQNVLRSPHTTHDDMLEAALRYRDAWLGYLEPDCS